MKPACLLLLYGMKTLETFFYPLLKSLYFGKQLLRNQIVFLSAFFPPARRWNLGANSHGGIQSNYKFGVTRRHVAVLR
jgi:hypothetical protein